MKKSSKAVLLSALIFPGTGHLFLKQYLRGSALSLFSLVALSVIIAGVFQRALSIVDRINSGDIPADTAAIVEMVSSSSSGSGGWIENTVVIILGICWLIGIVDSYRLGVAQEKL